MAESMGQRIAALRKQAGWTQAQLAEKIQTTNRQVGTYERDLNIPRLEVAARLARNLGVSLEWLITGEAKSMSIICKCPNCGRKIRVKIKDGLHGFDRSENAEG